jgi:hypothetical protein
MRPLPPAPMPYATPMMHPMPLNNSTETIPDMCHSASSSSPPSPMTITSTLSTPSPRSPVPRESPYLPTPHLMANTLPTTTTHTTTMAIDTITTPSPSMITTTTTAHTTPPMSAIKLPPVHAALHNDDATYLSAPSCHPEPRASPNRSQYSPAMSDCSLDVLASVCTDLLEQDQQEVTSADWPRSSMPFDPVRHSAREHAAQACPSC